MGWGRHGAVQMCRLRCYREKGGDILKLVKRQRSIRREREEKGRKDPLGLFGAEKQLWFWSHKLEF